MIRYGLTGLVPPDTSDVARYVRLLRGVSRTKFLARKKSEEVVCWVFTSTESRCGVACYTKTYAVRQEAYW